jgi:hypothetical protein
MSEWLGTHQTYCVGVLSRDSVYNHQEKQHSIYSLNDCKQELSKYLNVLFGKGNCM